MNTKEYITSGILEEYVLGVVSDQERREVECLSKIYPDIKQELTELELVLEDYAQIHAVAPPAALKSKIFGQLTFSDTVSPEVEETKVIDFKPNVQTKTVSLWQQLSIAASVVLALGLAWAFTKMNGYQVDNSKLTAEISTLKSENDFSKTLATLYQSTDNKIITLKGLPKSPNSEVVAFWNQKTNEVAVNIASLPALDASKQYQLWAIVDGKPVDMGMIDQDFSKKIVKMKSLSNKAAAFAITVEKVGGNPSPTMEQMIVMGAVS